MKTLTIIIIILLTISMAAITINENAVKVNGTCEEQDNKPTPCKPYYMISENNNQTILNVKTKYE